MVANVETLLAPRVCIYPAGIVAVDLLAGQAAQFPGARVDGFEIRDRKIDVIRDRRSAIGEQRQDYRPAIEIAAPPADHPAFNPEQRL